MESIDKDLLADDGGEAKILPEEGMTHKFKSGDEVEWTLLKNTKWYKPFARRKKKAELINLNGIFGKEEDVVAYVFTTIKSDKKQTVTFACGSDDGIKIWLNGEQVHRHHIPRPSKKDHDKVEVTLKKGTNAILMKITQKGAGWGFYFRILDE